MTSDIDRHFGDRLRRRRRILRLTQQQVGERVGVQFQQIQKYESGASRLSGVRLWELACALEVCVGYFYAGLQAPPPRTGRSPTGGSQANF